MRGLRRAVDAIYLFLIYFGMLTVLAMIVIVAVNVFSRFLFNRTIGWGEEVSLVLMVWFSMIGLAVGVRMRLHIFIEVFTMKLPKSFQRHVINRISHLCSLVVGIVMFYYGIKLVQNGMTSTLPATQLPTSWEYIFVPITGFLIIIDSFLGLFLFEQSDLDKHFTGGEIDA